MLRGRGRTRETTSLMATPADEDDMETEVTEAPRPKTKKTPTATYQARKRNTIFVDEFSREVFENTYKYAADRDINDRHLAIAKDLASVEKPGLRARWTEHFLDLMEDFKFLPGGRITSNAGTGLKGTTYINCFVSGFRRRTPGFDGIDLG